MMMEIIAMMKQTTAKVILTHNKLEKKLFLIQFLLILDDKDENPKSNQSQSCPHMSQHRNISREALHNHDPKYS